MKSMVAFCFAIAIAIGVQAHAGIIDLINGVKLGIPLPPHNLEYVAGSQAATGKPVLIDFWETTCASCIASIPKLNEHYARFAPKGLLVIGISSETKGQVMPALKHLAMNYAVAVEGAPSLHKALGIKALPYAVLVDGKGVITWRGQPEEITEALLTELLGKTGG